MKINSNIHIGIQRFQLQFAQLTPHLIHSSQAATPALALFQSPARQYAFYLESLARIYRKLHDKSAFNSIRKEIKLLEDQLGRVDFYHAFHEEFLKQENFPSPLLAYFKSQTDKELIALQQLMDEKKWTDVNHGILNSLVNDLTKLSWMEPDEDRKSVASFLNEEWNDFRKDFKKDKFDFTLLEKGVHEFRRQLRWFSIYAQALDGMIQLQDNTDRREKLNKYLTPEILNSPFNKMPEVKDLVAPVFISAPDFYAISWVINEIGTLKDQGLRIHAVTEAIIATGIKKEDEAATYAASLVDSEQGSLMSVSKQARKIAEELMGEISIKYEL